MIARFRERYRRLKRWERWSLWSPAFFASTIVFSYGSRHGWTAPWAWMFAGWAIDVLVQARLRAEEW